MGVHPVLQQVLKHVRMAIHEHVVEDEATLGVSFPEHAIALTSALKQVERLDHERQIPTSRALEKALANLLFTVLAIWDQLLLLIALQEVEEWVL